MNTLELIVPASARYAEVMFHAWSGGDGARLDAVRMGLRGSMGEPASSLEEEKLEVLDGIAWELCGVCGPAHLRVLAHLAAPGAPL